MTKLYDSQKDEQWYKEVAKIYMPSYYQNFEDARFEKLKLYRFFNGDISDYVGEINEMCNDAVSSKSVEDRILHYNKFRNKFGVLEGDLIRRGNHHNILMLSATAIRNKDEQLQKVLMENVEKDMQVILQRQQDQLQSLSQEQLQQYLEEQRGLLTPRDINYKTFTTELEGYKSKMLRYIYQRDDIDRKQLETLKDRFIVDEPYVRVTWKEGKPHTEVRNPLYVYAHRPNNVHCVSLSDYIVYQDQMTIGAFLDEYLNQLDEKEIEKVVTVATSGSGISEEHLSKFVYNHLKLYGTSIYGSDSRYKNFIGLYETQDDEFNTIYKQKVTRTHLEFKAFKEVMFYTYMDEYNSPITVILDSKTNIVPSSASKLKYTNKYGTEDDKWVWSDENGSHEVVVEWIPSAYEIERVGTNTFTKKREVPLQPRYADDPVGSFRLSTFGGPTNNRNAKTVSLMQNAMPYAKQLLAVKALMDKELAKYRGFEIVQDIAQVPQDLGEEGDVAHDVITKVETIARKTGTRWVDSNASMNGLPNPQRSKPVEVLKIGQAGEMMNLNQLCDLIDNELGLACGVSKSREGQLVSNTNVTDNQQSIVQTTLQTEPFYKAHSQFWADVLSRCLDLWDVYFENYFDNYPDAEECILEFIVPDGKELIKIKRDYLSPGAMGIFVVDGYGNRQYQDFMMQKIAQNTQDTPLDQISSILKDVSAGLSSEEIHRKIQLFSDDQRKRMEMQQKAEMEAQKQQVLARQEDLKYQSELRIAEAVAISNDKKEHDIVIAQIEADDRRLANDVNLNNQADALEQTNLKIQADKEMQDKQIEADKKLKEMDIEGKIKVEKAKPKPTKTT
jgi:hypothetical protein